MCLLVLGFELWSLLTAVISYIIGFFACFLNVLNGCHCRSALGLEDCFLNSIKMLSRKLVANNHCHKYLWHYSFVHFLMQLSICRTLVVYSQLKEITLE